MSDRAQLIRPQLHFCRKADPRSSALRRRQSRGQSWMTRLDPDEESHQAYLEVDVATCGVVCLAVCGLLTAAAVHVAAFPHILEPAYFTNKTAYVTKNYKAYENGTLYFDYVDEHGNKESGILGDWFRRFLLGEYRYSYGNSFENYCWPRVVPISEWSTSVFRAMQHKAVVQSLLRAAALFSIANSLFQTIVLAHTALDGELSTTLLLLFLVGPSAQIVVFSLIAKLLLNVFLDTNSNHRLARAFFVVGLFLGRPFLVSDINNFQRRILCDSNVSPLVSLAQMIFFMALFCNAVLQTRRLQSVQITISCVREEADFIAKCTASQISKA